MQADLGSGYTGNWTPTWTFTVTPPVPVRPVLQSPANGALTAATPDQLTWLPLSDGHTYTYQVQLDDQSSFRTPLQDVTLGENVTTYAPAPTFEWDAVPGAVEYQIQISRDRQFKTVDQAATVAGTTYPAAALPDGVYFWRVRALNAFDAPGPWSPVWWLEVDTVAPDVPTPLAPEDAARVTNTKLKLEWSRVSDAVRYEVQLDPDPAFPLPPSDARRRTSYRLPTTLAQNIYYWRVRAVDKAGNVSAWSEPRRFSLVAGNTALTEPLPTPTPDAVETAALQVVEAESAAVTQTGAWTLHDTSEASGGAYLYSSGSPDDALSLRFSVLFAAARPDGAGMAGFWLDDVTIHDAPVQPASTPLPTAIPTEPPTATPIPTEPPTNTPLPPTSTPLPTATLEPTAEPTVGVRPTEEVAQEVMGQDAAE